MTTSVSDEFCVHCTETDTTFDLFDTVVDDVTATVVCGGSLPGFVAIALQQSVLVATGFQQQQQQNYNEKKHTTIRTSIIDAMKPSKVQPVAEPVGIGTTAPEAGPTVVAPTAIAAVEVVSADVLNGATIVVASVSAALVVAKKVLAVVVVALLSMAV